MKLSSSTLFLLICIPVRLLLSYISYKASRDILFKMGLVGLVISFSFFMLFAFGLRKNGPEAENGIVWWNGYRPVHSIMYLIFGVMAIKNIHGAWMPLLLDALVGIVAHVIHYHIQ